MNIPKLFKSVRYSLAAINGIFLLTGLTFLLSGITVLGLYNEYNTFLTSRCLALPNFAIATGVIIILTAVLGFYAAISEHFYIIAGYVGLLIVILIFEIVITVLGFSLQNDASNEIRTPMSESLKLYKTKVEIAAIWDELHMDFQCCGVATGNDWRLSPLPVSCCHIDYGTVSPFECTVNNSYDSGCVGLLGEWLGYKAFALGVIAALITSLQLLVTAAAAWLAYRSRFEEVELES